MSFVVLLLWIPLRETPGLGTISNAFVVGLRRPTRTLWLLDRPDALAARIALMVGGVALCGLATAHVHRRPARPRPARRPDDRPARGVPASRSGWSAPPSRSPSCSSACCSAASLGLGTVLFALAIGPLTQLMLPAWIVDLRPPSRRY